VLGTLVIVAALGYAAYRSPHHWEASELALTSGSALIAAPELIERILVIGGHRRVVRLAERISRLARMLSLILYGGFAGFVLLVAAFGRGHLTTALAVALALGATVAFVEFVSRQIRNIATDVVQGGEVDLRINERLGPEWRWPVAGGLFLTGTILQLIASFKA
jgi:uncharacterized membrane protein (DUF485 family)